MTAIKKEVVIGECRLLLGDALEVWHEIEPVDSFVSDPPYGMAFQSNHRNVSHKAIANDSTLDLLQWACEGHGHHSSYIWMRWDNLMDDIPKPKSLITWVKDNHSMGDLKHEHGRQTEVCAFYPGPDHYFPNGRPNDVVKAARTGNQLHPTQKPVGLMEVVVGWTSGVVCDPFMGSGSTAVACAKMGRKFVGVELDPDYFEIAVKRVQDAYSQPGLFIEADRAAPEQTGFDL